MYKIIFDNENLVICEKSSLLLSVPPRFQDDERPSLGKLLEEDLGVTIYPVHRLDYEVSGLIMYAKNEATQRDLSWALEHKKVSKNYQAITELSDHFKVDKLEKWHSNLFKGKKRAFEADHGKHAITFARLIKKGEHFMEWNLSPITGRSHQLRFEMMKHGLPIVGDELYGSTVSFPVGIALRAYGLYFSDYADYEKLGLPKKIEISVTNLDLNEPTIKI